MNFYNKLVFSLMTCLAFGSSMANDVSIRLILNADITKQHGVDAIVNPANETLISGQRVSIGRGTPIDEADIVQHGTANHIVYWGAAGISKAIQDAAGQELIDHILNLACKDFTKGLCPTGEYRITPAFNLQQTMGNKFIIHVVGPKGSTPNRKALLAQIYRGIIQVCESNKITSVAIPTISTGIFGYPLQEAAEVATSTLVDEIKKLNCSSLKEIRLIVWNRDYYNTYSNLLQTLQNNPAPQHGVHFRADDSVIAVDQAQPANTVHPKNKTHKLRIAAQPLPVTAPTLWERITNWVYSATSKARSAVSGFAKYFAFKKTTA